MTRELARVYVMYQYMMKKDAGIRELAIDFIMGNVPNEPMGYDEGKRLHRICNQWSEYHQLLWGVRNNG